MRAAGTTSKIVSTATRPRATLACHDVTGCTTGVRFLVREPGRLLFRQGAGQHPSRLPCRPPWPHRRDPGLIQRWLFPLDAFRSLRHFGKAPGWVLNRIRRRGRAYLTHFHVHRYAHNHQLTSFQLHPYHNVDTAGLLARC